MCQTHDYFPQAAARSGVDWTRLATASLLAEQAARPETPLLELRLPGLPGIRLLLKDETAHPSGSLKHRLARSLLLDALRNGRLRSRQPMVDASSGSTAIAEAWFAQRLGLPFHAVMPCGTGIAKQAAVAELGGHCVLVEDGVDTAAIARALARKLDGCYLDQFGLASSA